MASLLVWIFKKLKVLDFRFFVGNISGVDLGIFPWGHRALGLSTRTNFWLRFLLESWALIGQTQNLGRKTSLGKRYFTHLFLAITFEPEKLEQANEGLRRLRF